MIDYLPDHVLWQILKSLDYKTLWEMRRLNRRCDFLVEQIVSSYRRITLEPLYNSLPTETDVPCIRFFVAKQGYVVQVKFNLRESPKPIITHHPVDVGIALFVKSCASRRPFSIKINTDFLNENFPRLMRQLMRRKFIRCERLSIKSNCAKKIYKLSSRFHSSSYQIRGPISESGDVITLHPNVKNCKDSLILDQSLTDIQGVNVRELFTWETNMTLDELRVWVRTKTKDYAGMLYHVNVKTDTKVDIPKIVNEETKKLYPLGKRTSFSDYTATMCKVKRQVEQDDGKIVTTINLRYHKMTTSAPWFTYKSMY